MEYNTENWNDESPLHLILVGYGEHDFPQRFVEKGTSTVHARQASKCFSSVISDHTSLADPAERKATVSSKAKKTMKRSNWKKSDATKPKRGLSAYNLFFQLERERLIAGAPVRKYDSADVERIAILSHQKAQIKRRHRKSHGIISFTDLARTSANAWKKLEGSDKVVFEEYAAVENARYRCELERWMDRQKQERMRAVAPNAAVDHAPVAFLTASFQAAQTFSSSSLNDAPAEVPSVSYVSDVLTNKVNTDYQKHLPSTGLDAILQQGDLLLKNPDNASADVLKEQIRVLEQEYMRQSMLLQIQATPSTTITTTGVATSQLCAESQTPANKSAAITQPMTQDVFYNDDAASFREDDPFEPRPICMKRKESVLDVDFCFPLRPTVKSTAKQMADCEDDHMMRILLESYDRDWK